MPLLATNELAERARYLLQAARRIDVPPPGQGRAKPAAAKRTGLQNAQCYADRAVARTDAPPAMVAEMHQILADIQQELAALQAPYVPPRGRRKWARPDEDAQEELFDEEPADEPV